MNVFDSWDTSRHTQPRSEVGQVRKLGCNVTLKRAILWLFSIPDIDSTTAVLPDHPQPVLAEIMQLVDGKKSCKLAYERIKEQADDTALYQMHKERIQDFVESGKFSTACLFRVPLSDVVFTLPDRSHTPDRIKNKLRMLAECDAASDASVLD